MRVRVLFVFKYVRGALLYSRNYLKQYLATNDVATIHQSPLFKGLNYVRRFRTASFSYFFYCARFGIYFMRGIFKCRPIETKHDIMREFSAMIFFSKSWDIIIRRYKNIFFIMFVQIKLSAYFQINTKWAVVGIRLATQRWWKSYTFFTLLSFWFVSTVQKSSGWLMMLIFDE